MSLSLQLSSRSPVRHHSPPNRTDGFASASASASLPYLFAVRMVRQLVRPRAGTGRPWPPFVPPPFVTFATGHHLWLCLLNSVFSDGLLPQPWWCLNSYEISEMWWKCGGGVSIWYCPDMMLNPACLTVCLAGAGPGRAGPPIKSECANGSVSFWRCGQKRRLINDPQRRRGQPSKWEWGKGNDTLFAVWCLACSS